MKIIEQQNIGTAKYVVNYHDENDPKYHEDGSEFYDIAIFKSKKRKDEFIKKLNNK